MYVDENGNSSVGISAVRDLREAKNQCRLFDRRYIKQGIGREQDN